MSKYNARPTVVDNIRFASMKELQPKYKIIVFDCLICSYIGDFRYRENGAQVVEDVKGVKTPAYRLKNKLMWAVHNIKIKET